MSYFRLSQVMPVSRLGCGCGCSSHPDWSARLGEPPTEDLQFEKELANSLVGLTCRDKVAQHLQQLTEPLERCLTDILFWRRHPGRRGKRLPQPGSAPAKEKPFVKEWESIRSGVVRPAVARQISGMMVDTQFARDNWCKLFR